MKSILPSLALASLATAQISVEVSEFVVIKSQNPWTKEEKVDSVTFFLNGYNADEVVCSNQDPWITQNACYKTVGSTFYSYFLEEGDEGSGIEYGITVFYFDQANNIFLRGWAHIPTTCDGQDAFSPICDPLTNVTTITLDE